LILRSEQAGIEQRASKKGAARRTWGILGQADSSERLGFPRDGSENPDFPVLCDGGDVSQ
jgi:hypothetical protein